MKKTLIVLLLPLIYSTYLFAQTTTEPCTIIGIDNNYITIRHNKTGQVRMFKANTADLSTLKQGTKLNTSIINGRITNINGLERTYELIDPSYGEPCCGITGILPDPADPCCGIVSIKNLQSGSVFSFKAPNELTKLLSTGDHVYIHSSLPPNEIINTAEAKNEIINPHEPVNGFAFIQVNNNAAMVASSSSSSGRKNMYAFPIINNNEEVKEQDPWEITTTGNKSVTSKFIGTNAADIINALAFSSGDKLVLATHDYPVVLTPGIYNVTINNIPVKNVPLEKSRSTRIKVGYFVFSNSTWAIYDETGKQLYLSSGKGKFAIPIGKYQIRFGEAKLQQSLKENETIEF